MAQFGEASLFVCRSCRHALQSNIRSKPSNIRAFSQSTPQRKTIPSFQPTSSADLDVLFADWRHKVFKPSALAAHHRALIYKKSRHQILENDPGVTVVLSNDEEVKLEPMNRFDRPSKKRTLNEIAQILGSSNDKTLWFNLPPFLEGMQQAQQTVPKAWFEKMARKAHEQGQAGTMLRCAERVKNTGVKLSDRPFAREMILGCHMAAANHGFKGEEMLGSSKMADRIVMMMESQEHCAGKLKEGEGEVDMRRDPIVIGVLLEFAAAKALELHGGKEVDGAVGSFVSKLLAVDQRAGGLLRKEEKSRPEHALEDWIVIANGLRMALRVKDKVIRASGANSTPASDKEVQQKLTELDQNIRDYSEQVKAASQGGQRRAVQMLEAVNTP